MSESLALDIFYIGGHNIEFDCSHMDMARMMGRRNKVVRIPNGWQRHRTHDDDDDDDDED